MVSGADILKSRLVTLQDIAASLSELEPKMSTEEASQSAARLMDISKRMEALAKRVTLRAKGSEDIAQPLAEATELLQESYQTLVEAGPGSHQDALSDFVDDLESLEREVSVLEETVRSRTLVLT
jgi:protein subunit release factor A